MAAARAKIGKKLPDLETKLLLMVMADRADGAQITVEDCEAISHQISATIDVEDPLPGAWTLEVSSCGIDRPLVRPKDWNRFSGHLARVELSVPIDGRKRCLGVALGADDGYVWGFG